MTTIQPPIVQNESTAPNTNSDQEHHNVNRTVPIQTDTTVNRLQLHTNVNIPLHTNVNRHNIFNPLPLDICSPVNVNNLQQLLVNHPNQALVNYVIDGFSFGFDIGFSGNVTTGRSRNLLSARNNPQAVETALNKELLRGHTSGPFDTPPFPVLHCSPLGAVPKKDNSYRIILDLSSPRGNSINEGIPRETFSVRYSSFDDAVTLVDGMGTSAYLAKMDIRHAFRLCPVRPEDWQLLGHCFNNQYFVDTRLPFGSRSSPYIFNLFADLLLWILIFQFSIPTALHYLDDFFFCASNKNLCQQYISSAQMAFAQLGVPLAPEKLEGPSQTLTYLGIQINAATRTIQLPNDKYHNLLTQLLFWQSRKKCTKRELLSLIGTLSFACKVIKPGRIFLRRLIDLSTTVSSLNHHIDLNSEARADINWWTEFLPTWNGTAPFQDPPVSAKSLCLFTDAAASLGFGAVFGSSWFSCQWPRASEYHISFLELFAVVAAVFTWAERLQNKQIIIFTDNIAIVHVWKSGSCKDKSIMKLIRSLFLFSARNNINIIMEHVPGHHNNVSDALSRLQVVKFHRLCPDAEVTPSVIPHSIWTLF